MGSKIMIKNKVQIIIGIILSVLGGIGIVDEIFEGMGVCLVVLGAIQLIRSFRYQSDDDYRNKIDTNITDERNKFIRSKAWSWAGYLTVLICSIATIICMIIKQTAYMYAFSYTVCLILVLFYVSYMILKKKY